MLSFLLIATLGATPALDTEAPTFDAAAHPGKKDKSKKKTKLVKPGEAKIGDRSWCLVSGEVFTVEKDSVSVKHEGKTIYFCCPGCDTKFLADPKKYLNTKPQK